MTTYNHTAIVNGDSRGNDAAIWNDPLGDLDAAIGNLSASGVSGASAAAQIASIDDRIDNLGVEAGNANAEVTAARTAIEYGVTPTSLSEALRYAAAGIRNVKAHGAVGDGVTDDTTAIQDALTDGGVVVFPAGTYLVTGLTSSNATHIIGMAGAKLKTATNAAILVVDDSDVAIEGLTFEGDGKGASYDGGKTSQHGISITSYYRNRVLNCHFLNLGGGGVHIASTQTNYVGNVVNACTFSASNKGISSGSRGEYLHVTGCIINGCNYGAHITGGNVALVGCNVSYNLTNIYLAAGTNDSHGMCVGCHLNHAVDYAVRTEAITLGWTFDGCHLYDGDMYINEARGVTFRGCHIDMGVYYFDDCYVVIEDCTLPSGYANTINNNYGSSTSQVLWRNNRTLTGKLGTDWVDNIIGGYLRVTHAAADLTYSDSASWQIVIFDTQSNAAISNQVTGYAETTFYNTSTGVVTNRHLNGGNITARVQLFFTKPVNWDGLAVAVFNGSTAIAYIPLVSFSSTQLIARLDTPVFANDGASITIKVLNQTGGTITLQKTGSYMEFSGL